jgi:hypothetical protein
MIGNEFRRIALARGLLPSEPATQDHEGAPRHAESPVCPVDNPAMVEPREETA